MAPTLNAIGLAVADMAASLAFYRKLGLDIPAEADTQEHAEATLPGGVRLMWDPHETIRSFDPGFTPATGTGRIILALECSDPAEVDATWADMTAAGFTGHKEPWDAFWGQRYAILHDPDGNSVELYAPLTSA